MKIFKLDDVYSVVCNFKETRNGFKHEATLLKNGLSKYKTKICYLNRTWESFEFESILRKVVANYFEDSKRDKRKYIETINELV